MSHADDHQSDQLNDAARDAMLAGREARYDHLEKILIEYPRAAKILSEIAFIHRHAHRAAEMRGLLITGPKGAGKTTLIDVYINTFAPDYGAETIKRPIMFATVPSRATADGLASALLYGLGDPRWANGNLNNKTTRIHEFLRRCETRPLILDEIQHFQDGQNLNHIEDAARWLKILLKDKQVKLACVFVGLEGWTDKLMRANAGQLGRLFTDEYVLAPLKWDETGGLKTNEFRIFLDELDAQLPFDARAGLVDEDLAWRCHVATGGLVNYVMKLIRRAGYLAIDLDRPCVDRALLAEAYDKELAKGRRGIPNPFDGDERPELPLPADADAERAEIAGVGRRPGRRKAKGVTAGSKEQVEQLLPSE